MSNEIKIEFLDLPARSVCCQCNDVLKKPMQLPCGHAVCEYCLDDLFGGQAEIICQFDNCGGKNLKKSVFPDMCRCREIQKLRVYCTYRGNGCGEVMTLEDLQNHISNNCKFVESLRGEFSNTQLDEYLTRYHGIDRENLAEEAASDGTSTREDCEKLQENRNKTLKYVRDLKIQNEEVAGHIQNAEDIKRSLDNLHTKITSLDVRLAELDERPQLSSSANQDGVLLWKIGDYSQRRQLTDHGINSPPFYSSCYGYRMCGRINLNGDGTGRGTHLSFFFVLMKGEYDALLPWPFQQRVTLMLMDQDTGTQNVSDTFNPDPGSSSFRRPETEMNVASGTPLFIEHSRLESHTYLQDDTIFLKIDVDVESIPDGAASFDQGEAHDVEGVEEEGY